MAVKRILRCVELEKSWLREHRVLMNHHHEHLIRCFWTVRLPHLRALTNEGLYSQSDYVASELLSSKGTIKGMILEVNYERL